MIAPSSAAEITSVVADLRASGRTCVPCGGGTLLHVADGPVPGEALSTQALDRIWGHEPADLIVTCDAGVTLATLQDALAAHGQTLPVWHPEPERATVGGLVAFGWGGLGRQLYGRLRDRVLEIRAVTGEAKLVRGGARVVKNVTGFDLPRLFFGSLGTLGVIAELSFKVHPLPGPLFGASVVCADAAGAIAAVRDAVLASGQALEGVVERTVEGWRGAVFAPGPREDALTLLKRLDGAAPIDDAAREFTRLATSPLSAHSGHAIVVRAAAQPSRIGGLPLDRADTAVVDAMSGVAWVGVGSEDEAARLRSSCDSAVLVSAPADVRERLGTWGKPPGGIEVMRRIKSQFDPDGVLAPGRFVV